ncbi:MAG: 30S ribosomal protein S6 [bacterium]|nr:30S ribosomal protein S6 [bacterium]
MEEEQNKKEYELTFLLRVASDSVSAEAASEVLSALKKHDVLITSQGTLTRQRLAYPIKKETQAVMGSLTFRLAAQAVPALNHDLRFNPHVLRFLMITPPIKKPQGGMLYTSASLRERRVSRAGMPAPASASAGASGSPSPFITNGEGRLRPAVPKKAASVSAGAPAAPPALSNEALEKRLEEILK